MKKFLYIFIVLLLLAAGGYSAYQWKQTHEDLVKTQGELRVANAQLASTKQQLDTQQKREVYDDLVKRFETIHHPICDGELDNEGGVRQTLAVSAPVQNYFVVRYTCKGKTYPVRTIGLKIEGDNTSFQFGSSTVEPDCISIQTASSEVNKTLTANTGLPACKQ